MKIKTSRTAAREIAMHMIYEMNFRDIMPLDLLKSKFGDDFLENEIIEAPLYGGNIDNKQKQYIIDVCTGAYDKNTELEQLISESSKDWDITRISKVSVAILKLCIYEMKYIDDVSEAIAINEAIELCHEYGEKHEFINGILSAIAK